MANQEQIAILLAGAAAWNEWRREHLKDRPELHDADLRNADLRGVDLSWAVPGAFLVNAEFSHADLSGANLSGATLELSRLLWANLSGANLSNADLLWANLSGADLSGADLSGAELSGANLSGAKLSNANLTAARVVETLFGSVDLSTTKGLDTVKHLGRSTIGVDTIYLSKGTIPDSFLRGAGLPDQFIAYVASLVGKPIHFYSCFISYSSKNSEVANRLFTDLQAKGVRCWFAPEDLKIGDKFRQRIDESIGIHDRLLLILSEDAIGSDWVETEVETAFEKEQRTGKLVLLPIRIDDAVMATTKAWAADLRRKRHIGDFRAWKAHDSYEKAFSRLLRDLKAELMSDPAQRQNETP